MSYAPGTESLLPANYYNQHCNFTRNDSIHHVVRVLLRGGLRLTNGPLHVQIPQSVLDLDGTPAIIASTHRSWKDIPIGDASARAAGFNKVRHPYKAEYEKRFGSIFRTLGGYSVDRSTPDINGFLGLSEHFLQLGHSIEIYPEGTRIRSKNDQDPRKVQRVYRGAAVLAAATGTPIITLAIAGLADNDNPERVVSVFGEPIFPGNVAASNPERAAVQLNKQLKASLQAGLDQAYGLYDEHAALGHLNAHHLNGAHVSA